MLGAGPRYSHRDRGEQVLFSVRTDSRSFAGRPAASVTLAFKAAQGARYEHLDLHPQVPNSDIYIYVTGSRRVQCQNKRIGRVFSFWPK